MKNDVNLFNAVIVGENGENPDLVFFVVEGNRLHAVDRQVANLKKGQSKPEQILPLMREALKALIAYSDEKVEPHILDVDWATFSGPNEQTLLVGKIEHIFRHLHHNYRNELSSMIHHKQSAS